MENASQRENVWVDSFWARGKRVKDPQPWSDHLWSLALGESGTVHPKATSGRPQPAAWRKVPCDVPLKPQEGEEERRERTRGEGDAIDSSTNS